MYDPAYRIYVIQLQNVIKWMMDYLNTENISTMTSLK